jgi:xanthine phosphoribosyltransferase
MPKFRDDVINHAVTWVEVHRDTKKLALQLMDKGPWKGVIALTRGAWCRRHHRPRAQHLCRRYAVHLQLRRTGHGKGERAQGPRKGRRRRGEAGFDRRSGRHRHHRPRSPAHPAKAHFATVYAKPKGRSFVDTCVSEVTRRPGLLSLGYRAAVRNAAGPWPAQGLTASAAAGTGGLPRDGLVLLAVVTLAWGLAWPAMKIVLNEMSPWAFRAVALPVAA